MARPPFLVQAFTICVLTASLVTSASAATVFVSLEQLDRTALNGALGTIDLTQGGLALDWLKPVGGNLTFAEKDSVDLLTLTAQGTGNTPGTYADDGFRFSWEGGDAGSPSGSSFQGSNFNGLGQNTGFRVTYTAPAAGEFTLTWYGAANNTDRWGMTASLGNITAFQAAGTNVGSTSGSGAVDEFKWTVTGTADAPGQVLTVDFVKVSPTAGGAIAITGVTVIPEPSSAVILLAGVAGCALQRRRSR